MSKTESQTTQSTQTPNQPKIENPFLSFDPFAAWTQSQQAFTKMMTDAFGRAQAFGEQCAAFETAAVTRAQGAIATWAQLAQDTLAYSAQLSAESRKLALETARRMAA